MRKNTSKKKIIMLSSIIAVLSVILAGVTISLIFALNQLSINSSLVVEYNVKDVEMTISANYIIGETKTPFVTESGDETIVVDSSSETTSYSLAPKETITIDTNNPVIYAEYIFRNDSDNLDIETILQSTITEQNNISVQYAFSYQPVEIVKMPRLRYYDELTSKVILGREDVAAVGEYTLYIYLKISAKDTTKAARFDGEIIWSLNQTSGAALYIDAVENEFNGQELSPYRKVEIVDDIPRPLMANKQFHGYYADSSYTQKLSYPFYITGNKTIYAKVIDATALGEECFDGVKAITKIPSGYGTNIIVPDVMPNGNIVTTIANTYNGWSTSFTIDTSVTKLTFPNTLTSIPDWAFSNCNYLQYMIFAEDTILPKIPTAAFYYCSNLKEIVIPQGITSIENSAFQGCSSLTTINIPETVDAIGPNVFHDCSSLEKVNITDIAAWCNISFNNLSANPIRYARKLYLNNQVIDNLVIPASVTKINAMAFYYCDSLISVRTEINSNLEIIEDFAFAYCANLKAIMLPASLKTIKNNILGGCREILSISVDAENPYYNSGNGSNCVIATNSNKLIIGCKNTVIPSGVVEIGENAFHSCTGLLTLYIPSSVQYIRQNAFFYCVSASISFENTENWYLYSSDGIQIKAISVGVSETNGANLSNNTNSVFYSEDWSCYIISNSGLIIL